MQKAFYNVKENKLIADNTYLMRLCADSCPVLFPGQFVNIKLDGFYLRRPISVCDIDKDGFTIIYKAVGQGTRALSVLKSGATLDILTGLGNGYSLEGCGERPLLIGGGAGVPPMYLLAKELMKKSKDVSVILGFNTKDEVFFKEEFEKLGIKVYITTVDGSLGIQGFVTDALKGLNYSYFYTCGPEPMLKAVYNAASTSGQFSFEERMGCGFGACMGCSCKTKYGAKRICKDGPVLVKEEIIW